MLRRFGVSLPDALLEQFDDLIRRRGYANRSDALRGLIRDALVEEEWADAKGPVVACLALVYDHHAADLSRTLTSIQHEAHGTVLAALHIHLDAHNCMEVLVMKGKRADVEKTADRLISTKGVKHGKLFRSTHGANI